MTTLGETGILIYIWQEPRLVTANTFTDIAVSMQDMLMLLHV